MAANAKTGVVALLVLALALLTWSWLDGENTTAKKATDTTDLSTETTDGGNSEKGNAAQDATKSIEEPAATTEAELEIGATEIERVEVVGKLRLVGPGGENVGGRVELVKVNETFTSHFSTMARIGIALYYDSIVQEAEVAEADGTLAITREGNAADFVIVFAPGYTPLLEKWLPVLAGQEQVVELTPSQPITVTVLTSAGQPIQDAEVWYRWAGIFDQNESAPLVDRFRTRFFQEKAITDTAGQVVLTSTFPEWETELFVRPGDFWATVVQQVEAGTAIEIRCPDAFLLQGAVTVNGKTPETEVQLKVTVHEGDQYWMLESGRAKEEGRYKITGIPAGYPAYQVEAMGEGFANLTKDFFSPKPGDVIAIDFAMQKGYGGSLLLKDPWGQPIPAGRIKFVAEGERNHIYGYNSDTNGVVELSVSFPKGETWWLNLRLGDDLFLRLPEPFEPGSTMEVTVPNLARITDFEIPEKLLGGATLEQVTWSGKSSQSWGTASWKPKEGASPFLASGSAHLAFTLSDGRQLQQAVVLAPGEQGRVVVDCLPTTLRFELPDSPPASVTLSTQDGKTVFDQEELAGQVSIPLTQGRYALVIFWPDASREIPLLHLNQTEVDLGKLHASATGYIEGLVQDSDGNPVQWADVHLTSTHGYSTQAWRTDTDGFFGFFDVPLGQYYILCDTGASYGSQSSTSIQNITVTENHLEQQVTIQIPSGAQDRVRLLCDRDWSFNTQAILATVASSSHAPVKSAGQTPLPAQTKSGWLGAAQILDGSVRAQAMEVPAGGGEYSLPAAAGRTSTLHFVDEFQQPWDHLLLRLELLGHPMTRRPTLDSNGTLFLTANAAAPWSLQVCAPNGQIETLDLAALGNDETIIIARETRGRAVVVKNESGNPIPWPSLQSADGSAVFPSDKDGRAVIPDSYRDAFVVSAPGYLACWFINSQAEAIVLPQRMDGVQLHLPKGATQLVWTSEAAFDSLWSNSVEVAAGEATASLPPMHAGRFQFTAFAADGTQLAERTFTVRESGQQLRWQ